MFMVKSTPDQTKPLMAKTTSESNSHQHLDTVLLLGALRFRGATGHELSAGSADPIPRHFWHNLTQMLCVKRHGGGDFLATLPLRRIITSAKNKSGAQQQMCFMMRKFGATLPAYAWATHATLATLEMLAAGLSSTWLCVAMMDTIYQGLLPWTSSRAKGGNCRFTIRTVLLRASRRCIGLNPAVFTPGQVTVPYFAIVLDFCLAINHQGTRSLGKSHKVLCAWPSSYKEHVVKLVL